jgi:hypothetical protein
VYRNRLTAELVAHHTPGFVVHAATGSIAAADAVGRSIGGVRGGEILQAAQASFTTAMSLGMRVAGAVSIVSALAALVVIPRSPRRVSDTAPREGRELVVASSPA